MASAKKPTPPKKPPATPEDLARQVEQMYREAKAARAARSREDPCLFALHVLRDEETGAEIQLAPVHAEWQAAATKHRRLAVFASPGMGKTQMVAIARALWELGRNPNLRIVILSSTERQAKKIVRTLKRYVSESQELHEVFPELLSGETWTETAITVRRSGGAKDPSVQAFGKGGSIVGSRVDLCIVDDLLTYPNSRTHELRDEMEAWFNSSILKTLGPRSRVIAIGNIIHSDDIYHRWARRGGWHVMRSPLLNAKGESSWPDRFSLEDIALKRDELGPLEYRRQVLCEDAEDADAYFDRAMFDGCLDRGDGMDLWRRLEQLPLGHFSVTGVDLGVKQNRQADRTVLFTLLVAPDGSRRVLMIEAGKWNGTEIIRKIVDTHVRYKSVIVVEDNSAQMFLLDYCRKAAPEIEIVPHSTQAANKYHPTFGVEGMAHEFRSNRWVIPNRGGVVAPEIGAWLQGFLDYRPLEHTSDVVMASWIAREYVRQLGVRTVGAAVHVRAVGTGIGQRQVEGRSTAFDPDPASRMPAWML